MSGHSVPGLTVVISPLQSLMTDQVDNLADRGLTDAVTINGLFDPITRALSIQRVQNGEASLLYIAPETVSYTHLAERPSAHPCLKSSIAPVIKMRFFRLYVTSLGKLYYEVQDCGKWNNVEKN